MLTAHQVRNKQRAAVRRREDDVEEDEITSGELNLVPYLDIVTNLMLFLLASVTAIIILGQLNTTLPDKAPQGSAANPQQDPNDQPLKLVVSVAKDKIVVWSVSGLEGTLANPKAVIPRAGQNGAKCDGAYMCESGACDAGTQQCKASNDPIVPVYDYRALNKVLYDIAKARYTGKPRKPDTYQAILMADGSIPYGTIVSLMSAMRCKMPDVGKEAGPCYLPNADATLKKATNPVDDKNWVYDTDRANYDPEKMSLFHDIIFSTGFE
ncbi:MAG TPA: biopolymer transporter ExbD [Kofleriaceae bacterium]|nr:biopolymer transporter ExbD [Kofleriaceae bacterium]